MIKNRVTEMLGIEYPVFQAPMTWLTNAEMVAAVSNAGGFGILGPNAGQTELTADPIETAERMRDEIHKTMKLTDKPFSVNYLMPNADIEGTIEFAGPMFEMLAEEDAVKAVVCTGIIDPAEIKKFKDAGKIVIYRDGDFNEKAFKAAEAAGVDMVACVGVDCGGHLPLYRIGTLQIAQLARKNLNIPFVLGGGIVDREGARIAMELGAEGVWSGTRFCASVEAPVSQIAKDIIVNMSVDECIEFKGTVGFMRTNVTPITKKTLEMSERGESRAEISRVYSGGWRNAMLLGDMDKGFVSVCSSVSLIDSIKTCKEIVDEFVAGMTGSA
jgi:enoyl-[acyl-carrier protein] reductase II